MCGTLLLTANSIVQDEGDNAADEHLDIQEDVEHLVKLSDAGVNGMI